MRYSDPVDLRRAFVALPGDGAKLPQRRGKGGSRPHLRSTMGREPALKLAQTPLARGASLIKPSGEPISQSLSQARESQYNQLIAEETASKNEARLPGRGFVKLATGRGSACRPAERRNGARTIACGAQGRGAPVGIVEQCGACGRLAVQIYPPAGLGKGRASDPMALRPVAAGGARPFPKPRRSGSIAP